MSLGGPCVKTEPQQDDSGFTLVELLVVMVLGSAISVMAVMMMNTMMKSVNVTRAKSDNAISAKIVAEAIGRDLRVAAIPTGETSPIVIGKADSIDFYTSRQKSDTAAIIRKRFDYDAATTCVNENELTVAGAVTKKTCLAKVTSPPVFAYYNDSRFAVGGTAVAPMTIPSGTGFIGISTGANTKTSDGTCPTGNSATDIDCIRSISVSVKVGKATDPVQATDVTERVTLLNMVAKINGVK